MKRLIASTFVTLAAVAGSASMPAMAEPDIKTALIALDGTSVDKMRPRHGFDGVWVIDSQNILYRDTTRDYYVVTLKEACETLTIRSRSFAFFPGWTWPLKAERSYEVRPQVGSPCDVGKISQVDDARADALRAASLHRVW
jgi:hypothetical protein